MKIDAEDYVLEYDDSEEIKSLVFDRVIKFFKDHESFSGESVMQSDGPLIDSPVVLADIADDIIKFRLEWK